MRGVRRPICRNANERANTLGSGVLHDRLPTDCRFCYQCDLSIPDSLGRDSVSMLALYSPRRLADERQCSRIRSHNSRPRRVHFRAPVLAGQPGALCGRATRSLEDQGRRNHRRPVCRRRLRYLDGRSGEH